MDFLLVLFITMSLVSVIHKLNAYSFSKKYNVNIYPKAGRLSYDLKHLRKLKSEESDEVIKRKIGFIVAMELITGYLFLFFVLSFIGVIILGIW